MAMSAWSQRWSYGFEAGVGGMLPAGGLHSFVKGEVPFGGAFEVDYGGLRFKAGAHYGQPSLKVRNPFGLFDEKGRDLQLNRSGSASHVAVRALLGYSVLRSDAVSITPLVGMVYHRLGWSVNDLEWGVNDDGHDVFIVTESHDVSLGSVSWQVALDVDIKVHSRFVDNHRYTSSVRITPHIGGARFKGGMPSTVSGTYYGITLSYSGLFSKIY